MTRRARRSGFGMEEVAERFPASVEISRSRRHGRGLGLRPSTYVGKHRGFEEPDGPPPSRSERRAERRGVKKGNDFGFGS